MTTSARPKSPEVLGALFGLAGMTTIVTGASRGLGARFAEVLNAAGATVIAIARNREELDRRFGGRERFLPLECDITVPADRVRVLNETMRATGRVDILVNNAAITTPGRGPDAAGAFEKVLAVDLTALYAMATLCAEPMAQQRRGSIINVSSISGLVAVAPLDDHAYCAAKGGVVNLTRQLGAQWSRRGIRVNSIAPGMFRTEMSDGTLASDASKAMVRTQLPIGRIGAIDEFDAALLYFAGPGASYVTGQVLAVDGGWTAR